MAVDLPGLAIVAGLLLPAFAAAAWALTLERRRPRRQPAAAEPEPEPDFTVAGIRSRLLREVAARKLADAGTVALPTLPIPAQTRREPAQTQTRREPAQAQTRREPLSPRLPLRVVGVLPPPAPATAGFAAPRFAFAPPDTDLLRRILDGLRRLD
ncbi:hypothetical protein [Amycolatopsis sp. lyj-109]|uniref:hypothetical protein n=1 Tax=Amycolatopsis sp. lyj-109 TaxID=2789287 RepID=UPI0039781F05